MNQPKEIIVSVRVRRSRKRPDQHVQIDMMELLFPPDLVVRQTIKRAVRAYRPTPGLLSRFRGLSDIAPDEWFDYFPKTGEAWTDEDREYLVAWWGRDDVMSLAYALERPPWGLQREVCRLRREGVRIAYLRDDGDAVKSTKT